MFDKQSRQDVGIGQGDVEKDDGSKRKKSRKHRCYSEKERN